MNIKEYNRRLNLFAKKIVEANPVFEAVSGVVLDQSIRVFENGGLTESGGKVQYKSGELWASNRPEYTPRRNTPRGKFSNSTRFKNGNPRKSTYFKGYAEYKVAIGQTKHVNMILFGNLQRAFNAGIRIKSRGETISVIHSIGIDASNPEEKIDALIKKYPFAFKPIKREKEAYFNDLRQRLADARDESGL